MIRIISTLCCIVFACTFINSQGCVAIRGNSSCGSQLNASGLLHSKDISVQLGYRYFKSFRHFRGSHEEANRVEEGTEVINNSNFIDLSVSYGLSERLSFNVILPYVFHNRSSMYEHGGNPPNGLGERHTTSSSGIGDVRMGFNYWLFQPGARNFNYSLGMGVKLPTGNANYQDEFYNQGEDRDMTIVSVVDQSIQLGDGGTGMTLDLQGFHMINHNFSFTANLYYLFNFRETNGVLTRRGTSVFSCPDQYAARLGLSYTTMSQFSVYLGGRLEGVPASDFIGGDAGYRRPGYAISVEPSVAYQHNDFSFFVNVPLAIYRNRTQSYEDKVRTLETGVYRHGDAAFADALINVGLAYVFRKKNHDMTDHLDEIEN